MLPLRPDPQRLRACAVSWSDRCARGQRDLPAVLERLAQSTNHADQALRAQRDGSASARVPDEQSEGVSLQERIGRGRRYYQEGNDPVVAARGSRVARDARLVFIPYLVASVFVSACASSGAPATMPGAGTSGRSGHSWSDSVLAAMTLRQKVAQMVWPFMLGDYAATDAASWTQLERLVRQEEVGGFIVSVGSPLDIAMKTNALQRASRLPLIFSADFETGAGFRVRGGYFVPNAIDLGGATVFPLQMALGAARDTTLAY